MTEKLSSAEVLRLINATLLDLRAWSVAADGAANQHMTESDPECLAANQRGRARGYLHAAGRVDELRQAIEAMTRAPEGPRPPRARRADDLIGAPPLPLTAQIARLHLLTARAAEKKGGAR